jgi:hypothetical protein
VAAFARTPLTRLLAIQCVCAALAGAAAVWFLSANWFPIIRTAIHQLPSRGEIRAGRLQWAGNSPQLLSENTFLALVVDLDHVSQVRSPAHVQVEFGRHTVRVFSLFGYFDCGYPNPTGRVIAFNRPELEPWWGAWAPPILWMTVAITIAGLMACWALLATIYSPAVRMVGFLTNHDLDGSASRKLAGAALMPGALLMTLAMVLYGLGIVDPLKFMSLAGAHVLAGWLYCLVSPCFAPPLPSTEIVKGNPFQAPTSGETGDGESETRP